MLNCSDIALVVIPCLITLVSIVTGTNIADQLDAANMVSMACPPPHPTPTSPVNALPPTHHDMYNPSLVPPVVPAPMPPVPMVQDSRKFVPPTSIPGGVVPKTERSDT